MFFWPLLSDNEMLGVEVQVLFLLCLYVGLILVWVVLVVVLGVGLGYVGFIFSHFALVFEGGFART